jgi:hypothetical protein
MDSYAHLIPQVKQSVMCIKEVLGVPLDAAGAIEAAGGVDESEMVGGREWLRGREGLARG